ncbi:hypothetical protein JCM8547_009309 [Rhodosporidiobolus lusitaniae]
MQALRSSAPSALARRSPAALSLPSSSFAATSLRRSYATSQEQHDALQAKQLKLVEKAGRMKQNIGTAVPIFANHVPPAAGRTFPEGITLSTRARYVWHDATMGIHAWWTRWGWKKLLGSNWRAQFNDRALIAYREMNQSLATGNYDNLRHYAAFNVIDSIKGQRTRKLQGLRMSWKLHKVVKQEIVCARQQELFKKDENVAQMVVRFVTEQSLEIRDPRGRLVGTGSHDRPETVTEYCVFQRDMWRPDDEWKCVKKGAKETDTLADPGAMP